MVALCKRLIFSYGAMLHIFPYLEVIEQISMQQLCKWMYRVGTARVMKPVGVTTVPNFPFYTGKIYVNSKSN